MTQMAPGVHDCPEGRIRVGGHGDRTRARARQAAKRRTFPLINSQIIAVADTGDLELFMSTIEAYLPQMNLVNLSTALHRLAKLTSTDPEAMRLLHAHATLAGLTEAVRGALDRAGTGGAPPQCQALSNITWSLATVQVVDEALLRRAADLAGSHLLDFKPFELSSLLWAFAKLAEVDGVTHDCSAQLFQLAGAHVMERLDLFTFRCLVMLAWAFAAAGYYDLVLFRGLAAHMLPMVHTASCHELATVAWSFGRAGSRQDKLFSELAQKALPRLADFKAQELVDMLSSFARNGFFHKAFLEGMILAAQCLDFTMPHATSILCTISRLRPRHHVTRTAMLTLLPRCAPLHSLKPNELSSLALATAKCFCTLSGADAAPEEAGASGAALPSLLPAEIAAFFQAAAEAARQRLSEFPAACFATFATALLAAGSQMDMGMYSAIGQEASHRACHMESLALLVLLRNLAAVAQEELLGAVRALALEACRRVDQLRPVELQALRRVIAGLRGQLGVPAAGSSELLDFCLAIGESHVALQPLPLDLDLCYDLMERSPAEYPGDSDRNEEATVLAKRPQKTGSSSGAIPLSAGPLAAGLVCSVKNTFLHVEGSNAESVGLRGDIDFKPLLPSLDIIPPEVSAEKLEAYRLDYQKFRTGNALGAKGELSTSMA